MHDFFYHLLDLWVTIEWFGSVEMNFMIFGCCCFLVFFTVTLVGLPFCFKKSCKWKKKIMGDNLCHFKQLKSLDIRYYHYTCHYVQFTKKSNSFRCTCTSPVWVMEHFAVSHHVVLCFILIFFHIIYKFINFHPTPLKFI